MKHSQEQSYELNINCIYYWTWKESSVQKLYFDYWVTQLSTFVTHQQQIKHSGSRRLGGTQIKQIILQNKSVKLESTLSNSIRTVVCDPGMCISNRIGGRSSRDFPTPTVPQQLQLICFGTARSTSGSEPHWHTGGSQVNHLTSPTTQSHRQPRGCKGAGSSVWSKVERRTRLTFYETGASVSLCFVFIF